MCIRDDLNILSVEIHSFFYVYVLDKNKEAFKYTFTVKDKAEISGYNIGKLVIFLDFKKYVCDYCRECE